MASRIDFSISCTPICAVAAGENQATETIAADVGKTLSASGSVAVTWGTTIGYAAGVPTYVIINPMSADSLGTFTSIKGIWVKHTGYTTTDQDIPITDNLTLYLSDHILAILAPKQGIFLPFNVAQTPVITGRSSTTDIAVEIMATV